MKTVWILGLAFLGLLALPEAFAANCGGTTPCFCGYVLVSSYNMTYPLLNCPSYGLWIGASNLVLDCKGYMIDGRNVDSGIADAPFSGPLIKSNFTLRNCRIQEFGDGIYFGYVSNSTVNNTVLYNNPNNGVVISSSFPLNTNNLLLNNSIRRSFIGVSVGGQANRLVNNEVSDNLYWGIYVPGSNNVILNNTANRNAYTGIDAFGDLNTFRGNTAIGNLNNGLTIGNTNIVENNSARNNAQYGISLYYADSTTVTASRRCR